MDTQTIGQFIKKWQAREKSIAASLDGPDLYRIGDGSVVLYIGISSRGVDLRLQEHLGLRRGAAQTPIGQLIQHMLPESLEWTVDIFVSTELRSYVERWFTGTHRWTDEGIVSKAEALMIRHERPCLNCLANIDPLPLPERYWQALYGWRTPE